MTTTDPPARASHAAVVGAAGLVVMLAVAAYWPSLDVGFVSDDFLILRRVSELGGLQNAAAYFGLRHFDYYRPLAFVSFAADWQLWSRTPAGYHATALCLHTLNALLVFVLSRRLMGTTGALVAAALFAVHPSSHEAVFWVSSRFDLLAAAWLLAGLFALRWRSWTGDALAATAFLAAVLSKESALALPVVAGAYLVLVRGAGGRRWLGQLGLFALSGCVYAWLRHGAGLASAGGAARLPKLGALACLLLLLMLVAQLGWARSWSMLGMHRRRVRAAVAGAIAVAGLLACVGPVVGPMRGALTSLAFAAVHLVSPIMLDWAVGTLPPAMWMGGFVVLVALATALVAGWRHAERAPRMVWLVVFLIAVLVPVSSMTEGTRYLYLACAPAAMSVGLIVDRLNPRRRVAACALVVFVLGINVWQVRLKAGDWLWASRMTEEAAATISGTLGGRCAGQDIVLVTAPVRVRGVYSNLNPEGLEWLRSCAPASMRTMIRVGLDDPRIDVRWTDASRLDVLAWDYRGSFVTSRDWRTFDVPLNTRDVTRIASPVGAFEATQAGQHLAVRVSMDRGQPRANRAWFFFSEGALHPLDPPIR